MHVSLPRMISPSSLSAFSASITAQPIAPTGPVPAPSPVQNARAQSTAAPAAAGNAAPLPASPPGRVLPRGSLLDLSV